MIIDYCHYDGKSMLYPNHMHILRPFTKNTCKKMTKINLRTTAICQAHLQALTKNTCKDPDKIIGGVVEKLIENIYSCIL